MNEKTFIYSKEDEKLHDYNDASSPSDVRRVTITEATLFSNKVSATIGIMSQMLKFSIKLTGSSIFHYL